VTGRSSEVTSETPGDADKRGTERTGSRSS
jgi:hypothetical protein